MLKDVWDLKGRFREVYRNEKKKKNSRLLDGHCGKEKNEKEIEKGFGAYTEQVPTEILGSFKRLFMTKA